MIGDEATTKRATERPSIGLSLPNRAVLFGWSPDVLLDAAVEADKSTAFESVWVGDNFLSKPRLEAITLLSAIAATTSRVRLGTVCLATFPMRAIIPLAIQWGSLDVLSHGRTILTVCNGEGAQAGSQFASELAAMGIRSKERMGRVEEGVDVLRRMWHSDGPIDYAGEFHRFESVEVLPKPIQTHVPIVIAVNPAWKASSSVEERALRRVARLGDGWQTAICPPALFNRRWQQIREYAAEYERTEVVCHSSYHLMVNIGDNAQKARSEAVDFLEKYYGSGFVTDEVADAWIAAGPAEAVQEKIVQYLEVGCTTPIVRFTSGDQLQQMSRYVEEIAPGIDPYLSQFD